MAEAALRCLAVIPANKKTIAALGHTIITAIIPTTALGGPTAPHEPGRRAERTRAGRSQGQRDPHLLTQRP